MRSSRSMPSPVTGRTTPVMPPTASPATTPGPERPKSGCTGVTASTTCGGGTARGEKEFQELLAEQGGLCAICGGADPQHLDHDHRTGWVRGILCFNCNGGLGQFRDSPMRLARAITYLRGTTWQRALIHPGVYQMCSPTRGRPPSRRF
ncbi:endonuclease VII domain-containing protein [Micromonospora zamorensis]|uniref:endonuclease VII domain-containing protein n=1 Tax=Micromonospora zamorensis TaxID=709883 RepID=UPI003CED36D5